MRLDRWLGVLWVLLIPFQAGLGWFLSCPGLSSWSDSSKRGFHSQEKNPGDAWELSPVLGGAGKGLQQQDMTGYKADVGINPLS